MRRSGSAARSRRAACRSPAWSSTGSTTTCSATTSPMRSTRRWHEVLGPELVDRVAENFHDYHVLARRDEDNIARLRAGARRPPAAARAPPRRRRPRHRRPAADAPIPVRLRGRARSADRRGRRLIRARRSSRGGARSHAASPRRSTSAQASSDGLPLALGCERRRPRRGAGRTERPRWRSSQIACSASARRSLARPSGRRSLGEPHAVADGHRSGARSGDDLVPQLERAPRPWPTGALLLTAAAR